MPRKREETRWEKYAREKNIHKKKKRDRMIWDEQSQSYKPRWGYKRAKDDQADWLIEVRDTEDPYVDKFEERRVLKKQRILKNKAQEVANIERTRRAVHKGRRAPFGSADISTMVTSNVGQSSRAKYGKGAAGTAAMIKATQRSTASMGRFDKKSKGEKAIDRGGRRRQRLAGAGVSVAGERERSMKVLSRVLRDGGDEGRGVRVFSNAVEAAESASGGSGGGKKKKRGGKRSGKGKKRR